MLQNYEIYGILSSLIQEPDVEKKINEIIDVLKNEVKAEDINFNIEGSKKFAYPIKKMSSGNYFSISFNLSLENTSNLKDLERKLNLNQDLIRYLLLNQTEFLKHKSKEKELSLEFNSRLEFNKGKKTKHCYIKYLGLKEIDFRDTELLNQFVSPYAKIFNRKRTGTSSKYQRKLSTAIKRARHMGLLPFSSKWVN